MITQDLGLQGEQRALDYLKQQGLRLVTQNFRCGMGEIDLIMRDDAYLVFIEVRMRSHNQFGGGIASITRAKQVKIMKTAQYYLLCHKLQDKYPLRFDFVSVDGGMGELTWIQDAFGGDY